MKKIFLVLVLLFILANVLAGIILAQDVVMEHDVELSEEQKMLWLAYGINPNQIEGVWVHSFRGTPEEAIAFLEGFAKKYGSELPEMHKLENNLGDTVNNTISNFGDRLVAELGQEWLESAKKKADELKDVTQISYIGGFKTSGGVEVQINIDYPYMSPISMEVHEGTYVTQTELISETAGDATALGEKISLDSELPVEYLKGEWIIKERELESKYDEQVPAVKIIIEDYAGSIEETEIEAERFLFKGEVIIDGESYQGFADLNNPGNMFAYPMCIISILKEEGVDPEFAILLEDLDQDLSFSAYSDLKWIYENAIGVDLYYNVNGNNYDADFHGSDGKMDYVIRAN